MKLKSITSFDGTKISYAFNKPVKNSRKFLVFLHGDASNYTVYKPFLSKYRELNWIALNIRNHGGSGRGSISIGNMVEDLHIVLKHENAQESVLIGNCLGAAIAVEFTNRYKGMAHSLILITPFSSETVRLPWLFSVLSSYMLIFIRPFSKKNRALRLNDFHKYKNKPFWYRPSLDIRGTSLTNGFTVIKLLINTKMNLEKIKKKVLIILCEKDIFIRKSAVYNIAEQNDLIRVKIIRSGHNPLTQNPRELLRACKAAIG
ncbi:alpha/beta hydrolase [Candidatus Woesearchaeota archaeon]|nr:alpha/beta hydrolase [Candidatus Woesearchaeota archaeon]